MNKEVLGTVAGTILGSVIEEGAEEVFPGLGELDWTGEIAGAISGYGASVSDQEVQSALNSFIRYVYRQVNDRSMGEDINSNEAEVLIDEFQNLHSEQQERIIASFRDAKPYEYQLVQEMLEGIGNSQESN